MSSVLAPLLAASITAYPGFGDRGIVTPRAAQSQPRIEATVNHGPIVELIVKCPSGTAIITYSKIERLYCSPMHQCVRGIGLAVRNACGR